MPLTCAVFGCSSRHRKGGEISFHSFPTDREQELRWLQLCQRNDSNSKWARICSLHFSPEAFERNLKYELLQLPVPKKVVKFKKDAIPTLHLPPPQDASDDDPCPVLDANTTPKRPRPGPHLTDASDDDQCPVLGASTRPKRPRPGPHLTDASDDDPCPAWDASTSPKRPRPGPHLTYASDDDPCPAGDAGTSPKRPRPGPHLTGLPDEVTGALLKCNACTSRPDKPSLSDLQDANRDLQLKVSDLRTKLEEISLERDALRQEKNKWEEERTSLLEKMNGKQCYCQEENSKLSTTPSTPPEAVASKFFSAAQLQSILTGCRIKRWSQEEIGRALTLKSISTKAYKYLQIKCNVPLPATSTLYRWSSKFSVEPGVLHSVLSLLSSQGTLMKERERLCVIAFDETSLSQEWTYDKGTDVLYEPKKKVQCVMIRGLFGKWKQVIYYNFDTDMSKAILLDLIQKVEACGFPVVAMVNDMCPTNVRLWNSLGVNCHQTSFQNPSASDRDIFVFADAPHLIKLVRNNFLDYGFHLDENNNINSECVREVIKRSTQDVKITFKLSEKHVSVSGTQRMNVRLAVQLLSNTTAKALQYFGSKGLLKSHDWEPTSKFIGEADSWFDIFNSRVPCDSKHSRRGYGLYLQQQNTVLKDMMNTVKFMKVCGRKSKFQFQKGILVSSQSLQKLYAMLKDKYDISYILTHKLNQDCVENLFASVRQRGGCCDHPSPVQFKYILRTYLLGKDHELLGSHYNTETDQDVNLSECSFSELDATPPPPVQEKGDEALDRELYVSAMLFASLKLQDNIEDATDTEAEKVLEHETEKEGLLYIGGYIARKFPQHDFLRARGTTQNSWISAIARTEGKLWEPTPTFKKQIDDMEACFKVYHGPRDLKPGPQAFRKLSLEIGKYVDLPTEVIAFFVKCRTFFRMRILNRKIRSARQVLKKMAKLK